MWCLSSVKYSILLNGFPTTSFAPSRGLRQGDPLSPFLFLICAEGFSALLRDAETRNAIHGIKICRGVPPISHLFFADESLLFTRACDTEADTIFEILTAYEIASGQKINLEKSKVSFSRNVTTDMQNKLQSKLNFTAVIEHEKYLGLPTYVGRSKKVVFQNIVDRVWKKLKGWKERYLSRAGREILLKSISQAIPTYAMQCFKLPVSILNQLNAMCRNFWWGQKGEERKMALISWDKNVSIKRSGRCRHERSLRFQSGNVGKAILENSYHARLSCCYCFEGKLFPPFECMGSQNNSDNELYLALYPHS